MKQLYSRKTNIFLSLLVSLLLISNYGFSQKNLSKEEAYLWKLKFDSLPVEMHIEEYIYRFKNENYRLFKNDEFEMHKAKNQLIDMVSKLPENEVYTIKYNTELEGYDFDKKGFFCTPVEEGTHLPILDYSFGTRLPTNAAIEIQFLNSAEIDILPINEEEASVFIKERKNYKNGKIDRSITLNISFVLKGIYKVENVTNKSNYILTANILQIEFFDDNELTHAPLGVASTALKAELDEKNKLQKEHDEREKKLANPDIGPTEGDNKLITDIKSILTNSTLNNKLKATLIKSTIELYQNNQQTTLTKN